MATTTPTARTPKRKYSFHIPNELYDRMRERCFALRGAPTFMSINLFVIRALEAELKKDQSKLRFNAPQARGVA